MGGGQGEALLAGPSRSCHFHRYANSPRLHLLDYHHGFSSTPRPPGLLPLIQPLCYHRGVCLMVGLIRSCHSVVKTLQGSPLLCHVPYLYHDPEASFPLVWPFHPDWPLPFPLHLLISDNTEHCSAPCSLTSAFDRAAPAPSLPPSTKTVTPLP